MEYEAIIGLEVHAQLLTESKMFCGCSAAYADAEPNTNVCPICLGMPGVLPVINRKAIEYTVMTALALNCEIPEFSKFDRKNYPYPDLMKGYQISQYDAPLSCNGWLDIDVDGQTRRVGIYRVHLEEDTAKLLHRTESTGEPYSLIDVNRSGVPLMEIVGAPDLRTPEEARQYLVKLRTILRYIGVSTGNMEAGSFRCDANVSIRPRGSAELGTKVEVKNMNSFRSVYRALEHEIDRQARVLGGGGRITQETRGWVEDRGVTVSQRSKEFAHDYRYFPEPDLPPLILSREWVEAIRAHLPELPEARRERFVAVHGAGYGLPAYDARLLTESPEMADYFESAVGALAGDRRQAAKAVSNWMMGEVRRLLGVTGQEIETVSVAPAQLADLVRRVQSGGISEKIGRMVLETMFATGQSAEQVIRERGLALVAQPDELVPLIDEVFRANPQAVADYLAGKTAAANALIGQVMRATRGKA
ncbi:MAG: Asp-tRNA(Asn)/Glu-tRNA(Gln) amidotransferase subunit GatB, partial [Chloroflexi bacterium]|nr:Asp-tRNA(Asn)/Glu-tRNA(Gln) amidotransferase subunit GatB [Chloroflexota bacterium]